MASLERHYISTGHLPAPGMVQSLVQDTHRRSKSNSDSKNSKAYPVLARVPSELFGVCVVGTSGRIYGAGDVDDEFSIMSVSKPFLFALICERIGSEEARAKLGADATGLPFSSLANIAANPLLPKEIQTQVDLGNVTCVSNDQLRSVMKKTTAAPQQVHEALRVNTEARLRALKMGLLFMAGLPLLAVTRPTSSRTTFRERSQAISQGQRPEIDLISLVRHAPAHGESKKTLTKGESQWMQSIAAARCVVFCAWPPPRVSARVRSLTQLRPCRSPWKKASGTRGRILKSRSKPLPAVPRGAPSVRRPAPFPVRAVAGTVVGSAGGTGAVGCVAGGGNGYADLFTASRDCVVRIRASASAEAAVDMPLCGASGNRSIQTSNSK
jgi:hypothetical protein